MEAKYLAIGGIFDSPKGRVGFGIGDFGLRIGDLGLGRYSMFDAGCSIFNFQFSIFDAGWLDGWSDGLLD